MRLLFLSRWFPYPANNGSKIRVYNLIRSLAEQHDVYLVSFTEADDPVDRERIEALRAFCKDVHAVTYRSFNPGSLRAAAGLFSRIPRSLVDSFSSEFDTIVKRLSSQNQFDAVIASQVDMPIYAGGLKGVAKILEEVEISIFEEQVRRTTHPLKKLRKQLMWSKWSNYMHDVMREFDHVTVVSAPEIEPLRHIIPDYDRVSVIPNGADLKRLTGHFAASQPNRMVYTGALTYYVNFDAMQFFLGDVFPLIRSQCSTAELAMAGRLEGTRVDELPKPDGTMHVGHLNDVRPFVQGGWVSVIPERVGGGTRIKLFESLALGTPVVATGWAAKGVDAREGVEILTGNTPQELANAILRLFNDPVLREDMSRAGRKLIEEKYNWDVIGNQLNQVVETAVRHSRSATTR